MHPIFYSLKHWKKNEYFSLLKRIQTKCIEVYLSNFVTKQLDISNWKCFYGLPSSTGKALQRVDLLHHHVAEFGEPIFLDALEKVP